jgi:hypothetical protein
LLKAKKRRVFILIALQRTSGGEKAEFNGMEKKVLELCMGLILIIHRVSPVIEIEYDST